MSALHKRQSVTGIDDKLGADVVPYSSEQFSAHFLCELRSDHAGETGAVSMYRAVLQVSRDPDVLAMAREHLEAEQSHLAFFEAWLPPAQHSRLIGVWKFSGTLLGWVSALLGPRALYTTVDAVERFVVIHYQNQLDYLETEGSEAERSLKPVLEAFQSDEAHHQDDAKRRMAERSAVARLWQGFIGWGSVWAAKAASKW